MTVKYTLTVKDQAQPLLRHLTLALQLATPYRISGTVMDVSAGASQEAVKADFPNGLPCISDADQGHFMATVYEQQPMPTDMTGVPVTLTAIDPNGNLVTLGTTTSLASGTYESHLDTPLFQATTLSPLPSQAQEHTTDLTLKHQSTQVQHQHQHHQPQHL